jgi:catechol 2,3-dioxygenase-like lactoylglutathione lyase family enzyme
MSTFPTYRKLLSQVTLSAATVLCAVAASAEPLPGIRGIDHIGVTVPNIGQAETFFSDVIGCQKVYSFGPLLDPEGTFMQDLVNVHPRAEIKQITMMRCGQGANLELFEYASPDQKTEQPRNSDHGGHHIAFYVKDIKQAVDMARALGLKTMLGPFEVKEGPAAGESITYVLTPWGMQLELCSYPSGKAYSKGAKASEPRLWAP